MNIDLRTALGERLARIRALHRSTDNPDLDDKDAAHIRVMIDSELDAALEELEASDD